MNAEDERDWTVRLQGLSAEALTTLKAITLEGGPGGITVERCHQRVGQITGRRRQDGSHLVEELLARGLVRRDRLNYREVYLPDTDLAPQLSQMFLRLMAERVTLPARAVANPEQRGRRLLWDLVRFLAYLAREDVRVTQTGQVWRRQAKDLLGQFLTPAEAAPPGLELQEGYGEPLAFAIAFCLEEGLVAQGDGRLLVTPLAPAWLGSPEGEVRLRMLESWRHRVLVRHRVLEIALGVLAAAPAEAWLDLEALGREVELFSDPGLRGPIYPRLHRFLLSFLFQAGFLEMGTGETGPAGRLTPAGRSASRGVTPDPEPVEGTFLLQPNFEVLAPPYLERAVLWTLSLAANLAHLDQVATYRLDQGSVYRALASGRTEQDLLRFCQRHSRTGVPAGVEQALRDWAAAFGRLRFEQVSLLRCDSAELADWVLASPRTAPFIQGRFSPRDLLVHPADVPALLTALRQDGHMPRPGLSAAPAAPVSHNETGPAAEAEPGS
ncbi:MAG: helicase-associated domain-containing protein [Symbiobacteriia bacterium]